MYRKAALGDGSPFTATWWAWAARFSLAKGLLLRPQRGSGQKFSFFVGGGPLLAMALAGARQLPCVAVDAFTQCYCT